MTLAATTIDNRSSTTTAHGDMRVFASVVRNTGNGATLHSQKNLWIQKDALGNKSNLVENRSATIKTNTGDLVVRTDRLENIISRADTIISTERPTTALVSDSRLGWHPMNSGMGQGIAHVVGEMETGEPDKWFGSIDFKNLTYLQTEKQHYTVLTEGARPVISAGNNLYLNAGDLINRLGDISAGKDAVLTGRNFISENRYEGTLGKYLIYQQGSVYRDAETRANGRWGFSRRFVSYETNY
ncbi:hypothetical protein LNO92_13030 [Klebsiella variicola subsp. variicola]|nr:hypothetical protein [Klebsiella variicola subsp. variicola]